MAAALDDHQPDDHRLDDAAVEKLLARARREVDDGLLPACQLALGLDGEIVVDVTIGAPPETRFVAFSATKALVAAATWRLIDQGRLTPDDRVANHLPSLAANGKGEVTIANLLTHTGGFPFAPLGPGDWDTRQARLDKMAGWHLDHEPGEAFIYHPTAGHWALAETIAEICGEPHTDAIHHLLTEPLGLPRLLGIPADDQDDIASSVSVGSPPTPAEMAEVYGVEVDMAEVLPAEVGVDALMSLNDPVAREVGVPGGGGVMRAADLARLYQSVLAGRAGRGAGLWSPEILAAGTAEVACDLADWFGVPAHRSLGLVIAGDDGYADRRGFGRTASARSFGHHGAGGQIAFADPDRGLSVVYLTSGLDQHLIRQMRRDVAIASLATACVPPPEGT